MAFGQTSGDACVRIVAKCRGKKFVALASPAVSFARLGQPGHGRFAVYGIARRPITSSIGLQLRSRARGIGSKNIYGTTLKNNEVSTAIYRHFLPAARPTAATRPCPHPKSSAPASNTFNRPSSCSAEASRLLRSSSGYPWPRGGRLPCDKYVTDRYPELDPAGGLGSRAGCDAARKPDIPATARNPSIVSSRRSGFLLDFPEGP